MPSSRFRLVPLEQGNRLRKALASSAETRAVVDELARPDGAIALLTRSRAEVEADERDKIKRLGGEYEDKLRSYGHGDDLHGHSVRHATPAGR